MYKFRGLLFSRWRYENMFVMMMFMISIDCCWINRSWINRCCWLINITFRLFNLDRIWSIDDLYSEEENLPKLISIVLVEVDFVIIEHRSMEVTWDLDHWVIDERYEQVIDASVRFVEEHHHVVVMHDFFLVQVVWLNDDCLQLHDANDRMPRKMIFI